MFSCPTTIHRYHMVLVLLLEQKDDTKNSKKTRLQARSNSMKTTAFVILALQPLFAFAFSPRTSATSDRQSPTPPSLAAATDDSSASTSVNRRTWMQQSLLLPLFVASSSRPAVAATRPPLDDLLYTILRVREATEQESRLIKSGKFKDVQRANVKLAVKFMVENYRLADAFVSAAAYLDGNERRIAAGDVGQSAVQNLVTILEYFDSSDVQNLKVGSNAMAGKEGLVLKGLDAARRNIDEFLTYFPASTIEGASAKIATENRLNIEQFDPSLGESGAPINMPPPKA